METQEKLVTITQRALNRAVEVKSEEPDADDLALFLEVQEPEGFEYTYDLYFDDRSNARDEDIVQEEDGLTLVIPQGSVDHLKGAILDLSKNLLNPGWVVDNPNSPSPAVGKQMDAGELSGTVEERIEQVLEGAINPSIAAHGGRADLERFEDGTAFLRLSGGCQGCGMAQVTLSQGIETALTDAVPEVQRIADVTDHESGDNPYFTPAKK